MRAAVFFASILLAAGVASHAAALPAGAAQAAGTAAASQATEQARPASDHAANGAGEVFGTQLFSGSFARPGAARFNSDYLIAVGDQVQLRLWGGYTFDN